MCPSHGLLNAWLRIVVVAMVLSPAGASLPLHVCGNYCGPGWCGGEWEEEGPACDFDAGPEGWNLPKGISCADSCCKEHDRCCGAPGDISGCNRAIFSCMRACDQLTGTQCHMDGVPILPDAIAAVMGVFEGWCCGSPCPSSSDPSGPNPTLVAIQEPFCDGQHSATVSCGPCQYQRQMTSSGCSWTFQEPCNQCCDACDGSQTCIDGTCHFFSGGESAETDVFLRHRKPLFRHTSRIGQRATVAASTVRVYNISITWAVSTALSQADVRIWPRTLGIWRVVRQVI